MQPRANVPQAPSNQADSGVAAGPAGAGHHDLDHAQRAPLHDAAYLLPQLGSGRQRGPMMNDRMRSARLSLAPLAVTDADEMVGVLGAEALYGFTGGGPPTVDELRARYARQSGRRSPDGSEEWRNWILRREPGGEAIGYVQATIGDKGSRAEIAWVIGVDWQGQGYATEAAQALVAWLDSRGVTAIQAHIHPD